jgi:hypothetical protein
MLDVLIPLLSRRLSGLEPALLCSELEGKAVVVEALDSARFTKG